MRDSIIYYPYRAHRWFSPFLFVFGLCAFFLIGYCFSVRDWLVLFLVIAGVLCVFLSKFLYDSSHVSICFNDEGILIIGDKKVKYCYVDWEDINYAYYAKNIKGPLFLVLSPKSINEKQVKQFVKQSANLSRPCIDFVVVIYMDITQDVSRIKELVNNKIDNR